jgi:stage V sporulation protein S
MEKTGNETITKTTTKINVLKVSSKSNPNAVSKSLALAFRDNDGKIELQAVGAGAVNQAVKAIAIARGILAPSGVNLVCHPAFKDIKIEDKDCVLIRIFCEDK